MKRGIQTLAALLTAFATSAFALSPLAKAADLPVKASPAYAAPVPLPSWSGWIVSGIVGGDWNDISIISGNFAVSQTPSNVAFGVKSELIYMFTPYFGVEHKLIVRYGNPSVTNTPVPTDVPYWRGDSFANIVLSWDPHWAFDFGVGIAAQTLKYNDILNLGVRDPTYGYAFDAGLKVKPIDGSYWVFGVDLVYENMDGFAISNVSSTNTNFGAFVSAGYQFH